MERKNFMITSNQVEKIKKEANILQISMSEVLRKAIDDFFKKRSRYEID